MPRRVVARIVWAVPLVRALPLRLNGRFMRPVVSSTMRLSMIANDYSLQWRKASFEGEARTRGVAQVAYALTGGAKPPPHIGRQSRGGN
jgi:hypothetical protein